MIQANRGDRQSGCVVGLTITYTRQITGTCHSEPFELCHDLRQGSPTEGVTEEIDLRTKHRGIYIPPGVAHGRHI